MSVRYIFSHEQFSHMGSQSGYECMFQYLDDSLESQHCIHVRRKNNPNYPRLYRRKLLKLLPHIDSLPVKGYTLSSLDAEMQVAKAARKEEQSLIHVAYFENGLGYLPELRNKFDFNARIVTTVHQPESFFKMYGCAPHQLKKLDGAITLSRKDESYLDQFLPGKVRFIPHGVKTDFFKPSNDERSTFRVIFVGQWLRDIDRLTEIIERIISVNNQIHFDIVLPLKHRNTKISLYRIAHLDQVHFHANLSDEELRDCYQRASACLLPVMDATANNGLLESVSTGLPIVSTNVGGIKDYTTREFAKLIDFHDVQGYVNAILELQAEPDEAKKQGQRAREFAVKHLDWKQVISQVHEFYQEILDHK